MSQKELAYTIGLASKSEICRVGREEGKIRIRLEPCKHELFEFSELREGQALCFPSCSL